MSSKYDKKPQPTERQSAEPNITIHQMLMLAKEIDKQTGRFLTYGELEREIHEGKINPAEWLGVLANDEC